MENSYLKHHGIKGMRWGIRRYQNKDGSLTPAGRKKYGNDKKEAVKKVKESPKPKKKSVSEMTDEELTRAINRARMEDTYRQLRPEPVSKGKRIANDLLNKVIVPAATNAGRQMAENALKKLGENILKEQIDPNSIEGLRKTKEKLQLQKDIRDLKSGKDSFSDRLKKLQDEANYEQAKWKKEEFAEKNAARAKKNEETTKETSKPDEDIPHVKAEKVDVDPRSTSSGKSWAKDSPIIDADFTDVSDSSATSAGQSYVTDLMKLY